MGIIGFSHLALIVSDVATSEVFYCTTLAPLGVVAADGEPGRYRRLTNGRDMVLVLSQVERRFADRLHHRMGVGLNHLALRVAAPQDLRRLAEHLEAVGVPLLGLGHHATTYRQGYSSLMFEDPDRIAIEVAWHRETYFAVD